jgi:predicted O-methyltransferase YrrM
MSAVQPAVLPTPPTGVRRLTGPVRFARRLMALPPAVASFQARARFAAWRAHDDAPKGALRADDLAQLLRIAKGRRNVVELGTSKGWTAISLAVADSARQVTTYDPVVQHIRHDYLQLAPPSARDRVTFVDLPGESGPVAGAAPVDLLFIDSSHEREPTVREYGVWRPALADDAIVVFDDYGHPDFPGVTEAVAELGLVGVRFGLLFVHRPG